MALIDTMGIIPSFFITAFVGGLSMIVIGLVITLIKLAKKDLKTTYTKMTINTIIGLTICWIIGKIVLYFR